MKKQHYKRVIDGALHIIDKHARKRMRQRNIHIDDIWSTAQDADEVEEAYGDAFRVSKMIRGDKVSIICWPVPERDFISITTVYHNDEYTEDRQAKSKAKRINDQEGVRRGTDVHFTRKNKRLRRRKRR